MKDSYTFDRDPEGLDVGYAKHIEAYDRIFDRAGLEWYRVESDVGMMGGSGAHEYMAPSASGENEVALAPGLRRQRRGRRGRAPAGGAAARRSTRPSREATPGLTTVEQVSGALGVAPGALLKAYPDRARRRRAMRMVVVRGDHRVNEVKLGNTLGERLPSRAIRTRWPSASARPASSGRWARGSPSCSTPPWSPTDLRRRRQRARPPPARRASPPATSPSSAATCAGSRRATASAAPDPARARHRGRQHLQARHPLLGAARAPPTSTSPARSSSSGWAPTGSAPRASPPRRWSSTPTRPGSPGRARSRRGTSSSSAWASPARPSASWPSGSTRELGAAGLEVLYDDRDAGPGEKFAEAELLGCPLRVTVGGARSRRASSRSRSGAGASPTSVPLEGAADAVAELWREPPAEHAAADVPPPVRARPLRARRRPQTQAGAPLHPWTIPNAIGSLRLLGIPVFLVLACRSDDGTDSLPALALRPGRLGDYPDGIAARVRASTAGWGRSSTRSSTACWSSRAWSLLALRAAAALGPRHPRRARAVHARRRALRPAPRRRRWRINWPGRLGRVAGDRRARSGPCRRCSWLGAGHALRRSGAHAVVDGALCAQRPAPAPCCNPQVELDPREVCGAILALRPDAEEHAHGHVSRSWLAQRPGAQGPDPAAHRRGDRDLLPAADPPRQDRHPPRGAGQPAAQEARGAARK